jgi:hypothetical protein
MVVGSSRLTALRGRDSPTLLKLGKEHILHSISELRKGSPATGGHNRIKRLSIPNRGPVHLASTNGYTSGLDTNCGKQ